eukprot:233751-Pyramimonas_sp.AAC.1
MHMRQSDPERSTPAAAGEQIALHAGGAQDVSMVPISSTCTSVHSAKILNTERTYSMLFHVPDAGYFAVRVPLETPVQSLSRTTGEVLWDALQASQPPIEEVAQMFSRRQRLVCTDGAGGITRMERNFDRLSAGQCSTLKVKCEVHMIYKWFTNAFYHVKDDTACMVHAAKALRWQDGMRSFRA